MKENQLTQKYIQVHHPAYWENGPGVDANSVEFSLTDDPTGEQFFFHFDFYNLHELRQTIAQREFTYPDSQQEDAFPTYAAALEAGEREYFIGALYYRHYYPDMDTCNHHSFAGSTLSQAKAPECSPYYAVVFLREERCLMPDVLCQWMERWSGTCSVRTIVDGYYINADGSRGRHVLDGMELADPRE